MFLKSIVFCAIVVGAIAGPAGTRGTSKCVSFCKESTKFGYEPGTSYYYDYTTDISTSVIGGSNHESRLHLTANVEINAASSCELILKLRNVAIQESESNDSHNQRAIDGSQPFIHELQQNPLRFSFQDGKIEHICAPEEESTWVLNIKRGILSLLQNTMEKGQEQNAYEVDVSGRCLTRYSLLGDTWTGSNTVKKVKDLKGCSQRHSHISALQSIPYTSQSLMQNLPLLNSKQECTQLIRDGKVESVHCQEVHRFQPFQQEESGAQSAVSQVLVLSREQRKSFPNDETLRFKKASLLFQSQGPAEASEADIFNIVNLLQKLEKERTPDVHSEAPQHFIELVENLKILNTRALINLFSRMTSPIARKYLLDAMPLVSSAPSLSLMRDLLLDGTLSEKQIDTWLTSLIFIKHPNLDMIAALQPLLGEQPRSEALFGISALINSYCKEHDECADEVPVQESLEKIFSYLGTTCEVPENYEVQRRVLYALKAIGNAGRFPSEVDQKSLLLLNRCFMEKSNPLEIRLAAIDAFRRMPCNVYDQDPVISIYSNIQHEDTELRIQAYLLSMKCAHRQLIEVIKDVLYTDSVNQVSSFVWTHLTNLQETSSPDKQAIRELLANEFLQNKFKTDARKYSRNYEGAYFNEDWNAGVSTDANIIFTPDSFLPRSGMLNLTVHFFGNSVNILEIGARVKALENILEPIFGPNGYFPDKSVLEALHSMRAKRDIRNNEIDRLSHIYNQASRKSISPGGSVYTRIFGHEVLYKNFDLSNEDNDLSLVDENGKDWMDMDTLMSSLTKGNDIEYTKSTVLLDATYTVSTSAGIPLSLSVQSAATIGITANGKIDMEKFWNDKELDVQGLLRPSAAIQVDGILSAQLGRASSSIKSGIRLQNTLHTSTAVQGFVQIKGSKLIKTSISLPQDKQEIFTAKSQILILKPSGKPHVVEQGPEGVPKIEYKSCKGSTIFGVEFCTEIDTPEHIIFPLSTPAVVSVYIQKTDTFDSYDFEYSFSNENSVTSVKVDFDTPGSQINRKLSANFELDYINGELEAAVHAPTKSFSIDGKYSASEKSVQLSVTSMDDQVLIFKTGLNQHGTRLEPNLFIQFYNRPLLHLEGSIDLLNIGETNGRANVDLSLKHLTQSPIHITGDINRSGEKFDTTIGVESYILTGNVRSQFRFKPGHVSSKAVAEYSWKNAETRTVDISAKVQNTKKGSLSKFIAQFNFAIPDSPDMNIDFMLDSQKSPGFCENTLRMSLGKTAWEGHTLYNNQFTREIQDLALQLSLTCPRLGVDYSAEFLHKMNYAGMTTRFSGKTRPDNVVKAELEYQNENTELMKKTLTAKAIWPENEYSLRAQLKELHEGDYEGELIITPQNSEEMKAAITYKNGSSNSKLDHAFEFRARGFTSVPLSGNAAFSASDKQSHIGGQLDINNKRYSTSLDYNVVKKSSHKIEGKLTLDERKYTGEINYRQAKTGDRILTVDLHGSKHVALEAKFNGDFPGPFTTSVFIFPDKDTSPQDKLGLQGTFDIRSINLKLYYFNDMVTASGSYINSKVQVQLEYGDQLYKLTVDAPEFHAKKALATVRIETPFVGYQTIKVILNHSLNIDSLETQFQTIIEDFQLAALMSGTHTSQESRFLTTFDMTGIKSLKGYGRLVRKPNEKSLEINYGRGEMHGSLLAEFIRNHGGFSSKFSFKCCESMPEFSMELLHQLESQLASSLKVEWVLPGSVRRQITADIIGEVNPLNINLIVNTPFENFERLETGIKLKHGGAERDLEIILNGNFDIMPLGLNLRCTRDSDYFKYEISNAWNDQNKPRVVRISSQGQFYSLTNAALTATLELPQHSYQLNWNAEKEDHRQSMEVGIDYDQKTYKTGFTWNYDMATNHVNSSVWVDRHNLPKLSLDFERLNNDLEYKLYLKAVKGDTTLLKTLAELKSQGLSHWDFSSMIESSLRMVPAIKVNSIHLIEEGEIRHKSEVILGRTIGILGKSIRNFRDHETIKAVAEFNLLRGRDIDGQLSLFDENIKVGGEIIPSTHGNKVVLQIESTLFSPVAGAVEYKILPNGYEASLESSTNGNSLFAIKAGGKHEGDEVTGFLDVDCSFGHHVVGNVLVNTKDNQIELNLTEDKENLIELALQAKAKPTEGFGKLEIRSELIKPLKDMLQLSALYSLNQEYKFLAKFAQNGVENEIKANAAFEAETKFIRVSLQGQSSAAFKIELHGIEKLESSLNLFGDTIYEVVLDHSMEKTSEMAFHTLRLQTSYRQAEPLVMSTRIGFGNKKIKITIQTPYDGWTELGLAGQFAFDDLNKSIEVIAQKGTATYVVNAEAITNRKEGKYSIEVKTPIENYTNLKANLEYTLKHFHEVKIHVGVEANQITARGKFSPSGIEVELKTPFDKVRVASASVSWMLGGSNKSVSLQAQFNEHAYQTQSTWSVENKKGDINLEVKGMNKLYSVNLIYDFTNEYSAELKLQSNGHQQRIGGRVNLNRQQIAVEAFTPFQGFETLRGQVSYSNKSPNHHSAAAEWNLNGLNGKSKLDVKLLRNKIQIDAEIPLDGYEIISAEIEYQMQGPEKRLAIAGNLGEGSPFKLAVNTKVTGSLLNLKQPTTAAVTIELELPLEQLEKMSFTGAYTRQQTTHTLSVDISKNGDLISGGFEVTLPQGKVMNLELKVEAIAPVFGIEEAQASGKILLSPGSTSTILVETNLNGEKHKVEGSVQISRSTIVIEAKTTLEALENLKINVERDGQGKLTANVLLNGQESTLQCEYHFGGVRNTKLDVIITTPLEGLRSVQSTVDVRVATSSISATLSYQNEVVRYVGKLEGTYERSNGRIPQAANLKLSLMSPVRNFENIVTSISYTQNQPRLAITVERNTKEEINGEASWTEGELKLNLVSRLPKYPISTKNSIVWKNAPSVAINIEAGPLEYHGAVNVNIRGFKFGEILLETSVNEWNGLGVTWNVEGDIFGGKALGKLNLGRFGEKSIRSTWRNDNWESAKVDWWYKESTEAKEKGFSLQYTSVGRKSGNGKFTAILTYSLGHKEQQLAFTIAIKRTTNSVAVDVSFQTPYELVKDVSFQGKLIKADETALDLSASLNQQLQLASNVIISVTPLASKLKLNFNSPPLGEPFSLNVGYDFATTQKSLEMAFNQNQYQISIGVEANVPRNSNEIELRMTVDSNVPLLEVSASGSIKAGYKIDSDGTRQLSVLVDSEQTGKWEVSGSLRLSANFHAKLHVSSPLPNIVPSIHLEVNNRGNIRQGISSDVAFRYGRIPEIKATFSASVDKILITFISGFHGFEKMSLEIKSESANGYANRKYLIDIQALGEHVALEGIVNIPGSSVKMDGSLELKSSWNKIQNGSLRLQVDENGNVRMTGVWGTRNLAIHGHLRGIEREPWWRQVNADLTLDIDSEKIYNVKSSHLITDHVYSLNVTLGEAYSVDTYLQTNTDKLLSVSAQWAEDQVASAFAEAGSGRFSIAVSTPWTTPMHATGQYAVTDKEQSAKGFFTYDGQRSSLEARARSLPGSFQSIISVDIPVLLQKLNADVNIRRVSENKLQGSIEMQMRDRRLAIQGEYTEDNVQSSKSNLPIVQRNLKLTMSLPSQKYPQLSADVTMQQPKEGFASLQVEATITMPSGISKGAFGYDVPINSSNQVGVRVMVDSPYLSENPMEVVISSGIDGPRKLKLKVQYDRNDVQLSWDMTLPEYDITAFANLPEFLSSHNPLKFNANGRFNWPEEITIKSSGSCSQYTYDIATGFVAFNNDISIQLSAEIPELFDEKREITFKIQRNGQGTHTLKATASKGTKTLELFGESEWQPENVSVKSRFNGSYGNHYALLTAKKVGQNWQLDLYGESNTLLSGKRVRVSGQIQPKENGEGFDVLVQCTTRGITHKGKFTVVLNPWNGEIGMTLESPRKTSFHANIEWAINSTSVWGKIYTNAGGEDHLMKVWLNKEDPEAEISIKCLFIPSEEFNIHTKAIISDTQVWILGQTKWNGDQWKVEGSAHYEDTQDMAAKLEFMTPFEEWDRITFEGKLNPTEVHAEIYTPIKNFPNAKIKIAGIPLFESLTLESLDDTKPLVIIGLPWMTYQVSGTFKLPKKGSRGDFSLGVEYGPTKKTKRENFEVALQIPSLEDLSWKMESPARINFSLQFPKMGLLRWDLGGRLQWKTWAELNAYAELNGKKVELVSEIRNEQGNRRLSVVLKTPFPKFEKWIASVRLENYEEIGSGRSILIELQHPSWEESIRMEIDYMYSYNGLTNMNGEVNIVTPKFVTSFPSLALKMQSFVKDGVYTGSIDGTWGMRRPSLKIQAGMTQERIFGTIEGMSSPGEIYHAKCGFDLTKESSNVALDIAVHALGEDVFEIRAAMSHPSEAIDAKLSVKTPFTLLKSASVSVRLSPIGKTSSLSVSKILNNLDVSLGTYYNGKKFVQIELVSMKGRRSLELYNPIRPVSIALSFERIFGQKLRLLTELCWDLKQAAKSTVGVEFSISKNSASKNGLFRVQAGEIGGVELAINHLLTSTKFDQGVKIRLFNPLNTAEAQEMGYFFSLSDSTTSGMKKYDLVTRVDTPWRSVQLEANHHSNDKQLYRYVELKWDILRDMKKVIGVKSHTQRTTAWRSRSIKDTLTLIHPALPEHVVFVLERTFKSLNFHSVNFTFQPTQLSEDFFTVSATKEGMNNGIRINVAHPASKLKIQVQTQKTDAACAVEVEYLDVHGEDQAAQITWSHDSSGKLLEIHAGKDLRSIFRVQLQEEADKQTFSLRSPDTQMDVQILKTKPYINVGFSVDSVKNFYFTAGMPHKKEISARMWRDEYGINIQDALFAFRLNTSQILSTKINWRPEIVDELNDGVSSAVTAVKTSLMNTMTLVSARVTDELEGRWNMLHPDAKATLQVLATYSAQELQALKEEFHRTVQMFVTMYEQNWFFIKDIGQVLGSTFGGVFETCVYLKDIVVDAVKSVAIMTVDVTVQLKRLFMEYAGKMEQTFVPLWDSAESYVVGLYNSIWKYFAGYTEMLRETYIIIMDALEGRVEQLEKKILGIGFVRTAIRYYKSYATWIDELPMHEYFDEIVELLKIKIWRPLEVYYKPYVEVLNSFIEQKNLLAILETPPFPYLRHVALKVKIVCDRVWSFIEAEQKIKELVTKAIQALDQLVRRNIPSSTLVWEVDKGQIEYHQPLVIIEWEDFNSLPAWKDSEQNAKEISQMNDFYYEIMDTFRNVKPAMDLDIRTILPPFGAHAVMAGDYHYFTFDKKYFRFSGECSYVLVADLLHKNFSLLVNYENRDGDIRKKSYSLVSGDRSIEIDTSNMKVSLDGRKSELPLEVGPTFIRRMPNGLEIFDTRGFQMTCSQTPAVCTITVSGWYFGKVGGLLGTYDNEEMNDLKTPDGQVVADVSNFAHSWRVGKNSGECRMKNLARDSPVAADVDGICSEHFDDMNSLLRPCFGKVDTAVFKDMCLYDTSRNLNKASRQESACTAISAYVAECQKNGVDVWLPPTCVRCKFEDGTTLISGENATLEIQGVTPPLQSSDVVVLLEEASCLSEYALTEAMRKLDVALQAEGLNDNRYAVIGFAGQGPYRKPHIRTTSGQIWAHNTLFRIADNIEMNGNGDGDLYEVIEFAARTLKFRAGVSKTFIAITCGDESCGSDNRYADTLTLLIENDIKLHMLTPKEFTTKGNKRESASSKIYGIDHEGVFTSGHVKSNILEADKSLKRQLNLPKDLCTPLAIETNGSRFHLQRNSKKAIDVWTRRIAMTAQPSKCQHCECIPDKSGSPHVVCNRCISPMLEELLLEWQKYQSFDGTTQEEIPIEMMEF
ncbi:unnamed protein product [Allacma fusca]|uniref:Vitellogenin domain-containing protein n=1 Tax=Allacma fusca TaxID=39272 RepID=A0A8J2KPQ8_9HEXA|nr:unnamed protein product [Allacma fusca]